MADTTALTTVHERLARRWPGLMRSLPRQIRLVRDGGAVGLLDDAVIVRRDWLQERDLNELQQALLHLAAHAALGHRPWHIRQTEQHERIDQQAAGLLREIGVPLELSEWHGDHHGQWQSAKAAEPGLDGRDAAASRSDDDHQRSATTPDQADAVMAEASSDHTTEITSESQPRPSFSQQAQGHRTGLAADTRPVDRKPVTDWRRLLQIWLSRRAWRNWRFDRPPRHSPAPFILPRLSGRDLNLAIALDVSGSISEDWLKGFLTEIDQLRNQIPMRLRLITCDNRIHSDRRDVMHPQLALDAGGGGGTDFRPVFSRLHGDATIDALLYCTDLAGEFPATPPVFPVFWLTPETDRTAPFGSHLALDLA